MPGRITATINKYLSLVKFSHTIFAMPFALVGYTLAVVNTGIGFNVRLFTLVVLCMVFARSAAMGFNRYIDRHIDSENPRTAVREIPAGVIKASSALGFVIGSCLLFILTCYYINTLCLILSPVALLVVLGYSYTKRFTALCHLILGLGLALAPIGAYLAVTGKFDLLPVLFSFIVLFWTGGFDIIYALQDEEFDKGKDLHSMPVLLGGKNALMLSNILHILAACLVIYIGYYAHYSFIYWIGALFFCCLLIYQHRIVKPNDLSKVNLAFFTTNGIASVVFAMFVIAELLIAR